MEFRIESRLDEPIVVGFGTAFLLKGWCFHPFKKVKKLEVLVDDKAYTVSRHSLTRFDVLRDRDSDLVTNGNALNSGFSIVLPFSPVDSPKTVRLSARATLNSGKPEVMELGELQLVPVVDSQKGSKVARVAICLITHNPDSVQLSKLLDSLRAQTFQDWTLLISDDGSEDSYLQRLKGLAKGEPRVQLFLNEEGESSYRYFERALRRVPDASELVAFLDQNDAWLPNKLEQMVGAMKAGVDLVYSDASVVGMDGVETYGLHLESALLANSVPLGACTMRRSLLESILPLPPKITQGRPEDWFVVAAAAAGKSVHVPLALTTLGEPKPVLDDVNLPTTTAARGYLSEFAWMDEPMSVRSSPDSVLARRSEHVWLSERTALWAEVLKQRGKFLDAPARQTVEHAAGILSGGRKSFTFAQKVSKAEPSLTGAAWLAHFALASESMLSGFTQRQRTDVLANLRAIWGIGGRKAAAVGGPGLDRAKAEVDFIPSKIAPLNLDISEDHPRRVNIVTSTIDFRYLFGGYFAVFSLALKLNQAGFKVRLVLTDPVDYRPAFWRQEIKKYHGLAGFFDVVEVAPNYERNPLEVSSKDQFIATSWWTAFAAHSGAEQLGLKRFIYLSQDFEPFFYPASSFYALALQSYSFPHYAIFSTEYLREYSRVHGHGVFKEGREKGDANSVSFPNAIKAPTPKRERLERTGKRRVLVYARPEDHANRNCFQLAALGLTEAVKQGHFERDQWELHGIGSVQIVGSMKLTNKADLQLLPKVSLTEYYNMLPNYDVGLSLMLTPHPSLVPMDMAASGLVTVTNTFDIKTKDKLEKISSNLVVVEPTIDGIRDGLIEASTRVEDIDARMSGTKLNWARSWDEAFDEEFVRKVVGWIDAEA